MDKEAQRFTRNCKFGKKQKWCVDPLEELIATQLIEELMEKFQITQQKRGKLQQIQLDFTKKSKLKELKKRLLPVYPKVPRLN